MKVIFQEFGTAIIAIITAALIIGILFGISVSGRHGMLEIAGVATNKEEVNYTSYIDFDSVVTWHNRTKPVVGYTATFGRFFAIANAIPITADIITSAGLVFHTITTKIIAQSIKPKYMILLIIC